MDGDADPAEDADVRCSRRRGKLPVVVNLRVVHLTVLGGEAEEYFLSWDERRRKGGDEGQREKRRGRDTNKGVTGDYDR